MSNLPTKNRLADLAEMFKRWGVRAEWPEYRAAWSLVHAALMEHADELERLTQRLEAVERSNAEFRGALESITKVEFSGDCCGCSGDEGFDEVQDLARAALAARTGEGS